MSQFVTTVPIFYITHREKIFYETKPYTTAQAFVYLRTPDCVFQEQRKCANTNYDRHWKGHYITIQTKFADKH
jgi:hypothetical protein